MNKYNYFKLTKEFKEKILCKNECYVNGKINGFFRKVKKFTQRKNI